MRKRILALALLFLLYLTLSILAATVTTAEIGVKDTLGREVRLAGPAQRVIALQPSDAEILYAIGAGGTLIGRGEYANYPEEVLALPSVQSGFETNLEQIIALSPDLLLMTTMNQTPEEAARIEAAGIQVLVTQAETIAEIYGVITLLGEVTGRQAQAAEVVAGMRAEFAALQAQAAGLPPLSVYFEVSPLEYGLWAAGSGTFMDEIGTMTGLNNVFADVPGYAAVSEEQVLSLDPDVIVTTRMYSGSGPTPVEEVMARPDWQGVTAVTTGKVYNADADAITRPGPRLTEAAQDLFEFVRAIEQP